MNGFKLEKAVLYTGSATCPTGEKHTNRILIDKLSAGGLIELPTLTTVGEIEIHAATGTEGRSFTLQEYTGNAWNVIGTYDTRKTPDSVYTIRLNRNAETKLRIANNTSSGLYVYKIATRTYQESVELNITSTIPAEGTTCYYNLTKNLSLVFNKEIEKGSGNILLNATEIPVASCTVEGNIVTVPVTLEGNTSGINYTVTVPSGAFTEKSAPNIFNNATTFTFQTYRTVSYPTTYSSQIDVLYSAADVNQNRMDIYYPTSASAPVPVVINIHGGGWNHGEKESQTGFNVYFNMGMAVANIEYRMTPQATAPAAVEDVRCAMKYLLAHASELNIDPQKIIFQGGSAGGHLALTAGYLQTNEMFDAGCNAYSEGYKVIAVIDKYGPSDLTQFMYYSSLVAWLGGYAGDENFIKSVSPLYLIESNTPPTYIIHGDADPTVPYSQSEILYDALQNAGVKSQFTTVPGGGHGGFPSEYNTQMNNEITTFLTEVLSTTSINNISDNDVDKKATVHNNKLYIHTTDNGVVDLYNFSGKKILSSFAKVIDIHFLPTGTYLVKGNGFTEKIIK